MCPRELARQFKLLEQRAPNAYLIVITPLPNGGMALIMGRN